MAVRQTYLRYYIAAIDVMGKKGSAADTLTKLAHNMTLQNSLMRAQDDIIIAQWMKRETKILCRAFLSVNWLKSENIDLG